MGENGDRPEVAELVNSDQDPLMLKPTLTTSENQNLSAGLMPAALAAAPTKWDSFQFSLSIVRSPEHRIHSSKTSFPLVWTKLWHSGTSIFFFLIFILYWSIAY